MTDINILKFEGKPIEKLIDVISKGLGKYYEPTAIKRKADAKAYEISVLSRAKIKAQSEEKEREVETLQRIGDRLIYKELNKQRNIDATINIAVEQISQEESVSEEPVNEDWITRYFNIIEDVSDSEMQKLWGQILAGEIKRPTTYSLRTLELLKSLSSEEAKIFNKVAQFAFKTTTEAFLLKENKSFGITSTDLLSLSEAGLISQTNFLIYNIYPNKTAWYKIADKVILVKNKEFGVLLFTSSAVQLLNLTNQIFNIEYAQAFYNVLKGDNMEIAYADFQSMDKERIHFNNVRSFE